jgi:SAM-dependent methyltransferase
MARQCSINRRPGPLGRTVSARAAQPHGLLGRLLGHLWVHETAALNDQTIALLAAQPGDAVLEIGCGPGRTVATLAVHGARVTGVDPSPTMLAQARRRSARAIRTGQVDLLTGHASALPAPDQSFECALTVHTIYFWPDLHAGLREIHRILVPGGRVAIAFRPAELGLPAALTHRSTADQPPTNSPKPYTPPDSSTTPSTKTSTRRSSWPTPRTAHPPTTPTKPRTLRPPTRWHDERVRQNGQW